MNNVMALRRVEGFVVNTQLSVDVVCQLHERCDRCVEPALFNIASHLVYRPVRLATDREQSLRELEIGSIGSLTNQHALELKEKPPHARQKPMAPLHALFIPIEILFRRGREKAEEPPRIGAKFFNNGSV